jgi:GNAT superfamily N-acetyltransferase
MSKSPRIREACERDIPAIARLLVDTWRATFRDLLPDSFPSAMSYAEQEERHRRRMRQPEIRYRLAEAADGVVIGFANAGRNRVAECAAPLELYAISVAEAHQGQGLGRRLVAAIARDGCASGRTSMAVEALAANPHRGFYEHLGARPLGARRLSLGELAVPTVLYLWEDLRAIATARRFVAAGSSATARIARLPSAR